MSPAVPLLLATLLTAPGDVQTTALSVDVEFRCAAPVTRNLVLTPDAQALLEVPEGCPDAGRPWRLMLRCEKERCTGAVLAERGSIARVHGTPTKLQVDRALRLEEPVPLDCAKSAGWCTGKAELTVREGHPR